MTGLSLEKIKLLGIILTSTVYHNETEDFQKILVTILRKKLFMQWHKTMIKMINYNGYGIAFDDSDIFSFTGGGFALKVISWCRL